MVTALFLTFNSKPIIKNRAGGVCNFEDSRGNVGCPSTCQIYKQIEVVENLIRGHWTKVKSNFEVNYDKSGELNSSREILEQLLIRLQKIQKEWFFDETLNDQKNK